MHRIKEATCVALMLEADNQIALSTMTVAPWTILSSSAAIANGRCFPSALSM
jgi:hypothetical protein